MGGHVQSQEEVAVAGRRADGEERQEWMSLKGTCRTGRHRHSQRMARWTAAVWAPVALALTLVVGRAGCFAPGAMSRPRLPTSATRGAERRPWSFVEAFTCKIDGTPNGRGLNSLSRWHEAGRQGHGGGEGRGMMGPGGKQWPEAAGQGKGTARGRRTALRDTESRLVKDHMRKLTSKGTPGVDGAVAKPADESAAAQREQQVKGWGKVSLTGGKIGKAKIDVDYENEDPDSTSVRFLGGWAETFPSIVEDSRVDSISPVRIPFLLGTQRGARATMAILAPPESMTLYKRIPFLTGTRRPISYAESPVVGMGEDEMTSLSTSRAIERAKSIRAKARLELHAYKARTRWQKMQADSGEATIPAIFPSHRSSNLDFHDDMASFDQSLFADYGLVASGGGSGVKLADAHKGPAFAVWGKPRGGGLDPLVSTWSVRVDRCKGIIFMGVMDNVEAWQAEGWPRCPARSLGADAWMVGSYGYVCETSKEGQVPLTERAKAEVGDKSAGALKFGEGDEIRMTLDRGQGTLEVQIGSLRPFRMSGVSGTSCPFVNLSGEGDCVTLCSMGGDAADFFSGSLSGSYSEESEPGPPQVVVDNRGKPITQEQLRRIREAADSFWS